MIPSRYDYLGQIFRFILKRVVRGNIALLLPSIALGVLGRILSLGGFVMTLQAIVATIRPDLIQRIAQKIATKLGLGFTIEADLLIPILIAMILAIYVGNWMVQYLRSRLLNRLNHRIFSDSRNFAAGRSLDDDLFVIETVPTAAQATEKSLETSLFILLVVLLIALLAPMLALMLLPLLGILVVINVLGDRAKLRELKQQTDARKDYVNQREPDGRLLKRARPENSEARRAYLTIREKRRHRTALKPYADGLVGAAAISLVIFYLSEAHFSSEQLAGLLILFVIGIRNVINAGRELSVNVSRLLELRKHTDVIGTLVAPTPH